MVGMQLDLYYDSNITIDCHVILYTFSENSAWTQVRRFINANKENEFVQ